MFNDLPLIDIIAIINFFVGMTNFDLNNEQHKHLAIQDDRLRLIETKVNKILKILEEQNGRQT